MRWYLTSVLFQVPWTQTNLGKGQLMVGILIKNKSLTSWSRSLIRLVLELERDSWF